MNILPYRDIFPKLGAGVFIAPGAWVIGDVEIGANSSIWFNSVVRGDEHYIRIGSDTNVQDNCSLHVTEGQYYLEIGNRVSIGHRAVVHGCIVEDDCLIGMGAIILDGAKIGRGSVIAAGSVITQGFVVPPQSVVMGIPAKVIKSVSELERQRLNATLSHYHQLVAEYLSPTEDAKTVKGFLG